MLGAVGGGFVVHRFTLRREILSAQRTQRVTFLLDAYRKLIDASNRCDISPSQRNYLEAAVDDIMLLGGRNEIAAAHRFLKEFVQDGEAIHDLVINVLRDSLGRELEIESVPLPEPYSLRISLDENKA